MFGNLKSKLGDATDLKKYSAPQVLSSLTGSRQRSNQHTPGSHTPSSSLSKHSRQPSNASLHELGGSPPNTIPESNELNYVSHEKAKYIEEMEKELDKLRNALELQQDAALQRLSAKEQEWKNKLQKELKKVTSLDEEVKKLKNIEESLNKKLKKKERESKTSKEEITHKEATIKELEKKLIELQENYDQMEGFNRQEEAKIKHLLLNSTSELESTKSQVEQKTKEIENMQQRFTSLSGLEDKISLLHEEKMELETKVAGLSQKLDLSNSKIVAQTEEHMEEIKHLQEKIATLDKRHSHDSMEETEKVQALIKEREIVEHKMEEARQQLHNIKTSWSDKITSLEKQIQNLNEKMAEDQGDLKQAEEIIETLRKEIGRLEEENKLQVRNSDDVQKLLKDEKLHVEEELEVLTSKLHVTSNQNEKEIKELRRNLHVQEEGNKQMIESVESKEQEILELKNETFQLESELSAITSDCATLQERNHALQTANNSLQEYLNHERKTAEVLQIELESVKSKLETVSSERTKLSSNLDAYLEKVNFYESKTLECEKQNQINVEQINILENKLEESENANRDLLKVVREYEVDFHNKIEQSDLVKNLKEKVKIFEDEVAEKKQMLKVQANRLTDMKKTIQRELKINPDSNDTINDSCAVLQLSPRTHQAGYDKSPPPFHRVQITPKENQNGNPEINPISLEYLKHVVLKFITSREYEAVQLTRALSTLLHMTPDEENLLKETLEWKMSWFGSRPNIGKGQQAKAIPPTQ